MRAQGLEHTNLLSSIAFADEQTFRICGQVNQHNFLIWSSEPHREHSESESE
jgi:hypothetical protein